MGQSVDTTINHLLLRNVSEIITRDELEKKLKQDQKLTVYLGVDPSGAEIHLGHAVVLWKLREFQDLGHHVIFLIGDFTAQIGDPTGKSKERIPLTHQQVLENAKSYQEQASKIVRFDGENPAELRFNSQWLNKLTLKEVVELAHHFTVSQMIERDMFQERIKANQAIGLHEFLYPLMVGYDSVALDVDVEIGGNDQLFNIKAGRILMEKMKGKKKVVLVCDLLTGSDGSKMSKSAGNVIAITATPEDMFGKLMAIDDNLIPEYALLASDMSDAEIETIKSRLATDENPRDVKLDVAERIVSRYSDDDQAASAREQFTIMYSKRTNYQGNAEVSSFFPAPLPTMSVLELIAVVTGQSKGATRRLIMAGGVDVDDTAVTDPGHTVDLAQSHVLKIGKHRFVRVQYLSDTHP